VITLLTSRNFYVMVALDGVLLALSLFLAYFLRFDGLIPQNELKQFAGLVVWAAPLKVMTFLLFGLYRGMWRYTGIQDLKNLIKACATSSGIIVVFLILTVRFEGYPRSIFPIDFGASLLLASGVRIGIRLYFHRRGYLQEALFFHKSTGDKQAKQVLIFGAGDAGEKTAREMDDNPSLGYRAVGFIDDDRGKRGRSVHGITVLGGTEVIDRTVKKLGVDEVFIAVPSAPGETIRRVVSACEACGVRFKTLPGISELIDGRVSIKALRDVNYEDLLGRDPVCLDVEAIGYYLRDACVLVTGAGGSIGSELCRQIVGYNPSTLILMDASEPALYAIQMELKHKVGYLQYKTLLGRVERAELMTSVFDRYRPQVVFHAAAYKHVPLLERNPWEAVFNNILGTRTLIEAAVTAGVDRLVLVSTDKAVRPTNVMGASKRVCEMILQAHQGDASRLMAVRFGNVVGSSGSVVPLFRDQIARGGPVTVTHPEVTRFFMTIPEAARLILQAGAQGVGDEIFILEMGTPVKIADMARDLIQLSGKEPEKDIQIVFTGLRQGEKLYEELITQDEGVVETEHEKILVLRNTHDLWDGYGDQDGYRRWLFDGIEELRQLALRQDGEGIRRKLKEMVPEYAPQDGECVL